MDAVVFEHDVDGRIEFDATHLRAGELALGPDVVDVIAGDLAEDGTQAAANSGLLTIVDGVVADDMGTDVFTGPADDQSPDDNFVVVKGPVLQGSLVQTL